MTCSDVSSINLLNYVLCFMQGEDLEVTGVSAPDPYPRRLTCLAVLSFDNTSSFILFERKPVLFRPTFNLLVL